MHPENKLRSTGLWLTFFCIAIGFLESAVVIYLRELYYPNGFGFPLAVMSDKVALTEILREVSTMVILFTIANLAGRNRMERFAWFFYCFAVWDIFYYVFLKIMIGWPESWFTWDILFLIPTTWTGPVIAPILVSTSMILFTALLLWIDKRKPDAAINKSLILVLIIGAVIVFVSFIWDYSAYMLRHCSVAELIDQQKVQQVLRSYKPEHFTWWLFLAGMAIICFGFLRLYQTSKSDTGIV